jgi:hypothetical protein
MYRAPGAIRRNHLQGDWGGREIYACLPELPELPVNCAPLIALCAVPQIPKTRSPGIAGWILAVLLAACGGPPEITNTRPTSRDLAEAVLRAFERRDVDALRSLALTEQEFRDHIWPELPAARPERNLPFAHVWGDLRQKSEQVLAQSLAKNGGRPFVLVRVEYAGGTTKYGSYLVHRDTVLVVRGRDGIEGLRLYGSTLEKDSAFKVFSYVVDDD